MVLMLVHRHAAEEGGQRSEASRDRGVQGWAGPAYELAHELVVLPWPRVDLQGVMRRTHLRLQLPRPAVQYHQLLLKAPAAPAPFPPPPPPDDLTLG